MTCNRHLLRLLITPSVLQRYDRRCYLTTVNCLGALSLSFMSAPSHSESVIATTNAPTSSITQSSFAANHSPVANADLVALEKSSIAFNVLANDADADGDRLIIVEASAKFGAVAFTADGLLGYAQNPGPAHADKITYIVSDGSGGSAVGTVEVVAGQNDGAQ